jgi:hypothetical protein
MVMPSYKSKSKSDPLHAMKVLRGRGGIAPTHLGEWSASRPSCALLPDNDPQYGLDRRLGGPQCWCPEARGKSRLPLLGIKLQSFSL